jgi:hypothetical protein
VVSVTAYSTLSRTGSPGLRWRAQVEMYRPGLCISRAIIIIIIIVTGLTQQCQAFALPVAYSILPNCTNYTNIGWLATPRDIIIILRAVHQPHVWVCTGVPGISAKHPAHGLPGES